MMRITDAYSRILMHPRGMISADIGSLVFSKMHSVHFHVSIWSNVSSSFHCPILDNKLILDKLRPMETDVSDMTSKGPIDMLMWNLVEPFGS